MVFANRIGDSPSSCKKDGIADVFDPNRSVSVYITWTALWELLAHSR